MLKRVRDFLTDASGATAIEYALLSSLIAVFIIAALQGLGTKLSSEFAEVGSALK
jgi:pilus assembly protein Flp/PilA